MILEVVEYEHGGSKHKMDDVAKIVLINQMC